MRKTPRPHLPSPTHHPLRLATAAVLVIAALSGCTGVDTSKPAQSALPGFTPSTAATTSKNSGAAASDDVDHSALLLSAADLSDVEDTFTERSKQSQPRGAPGASAFFVNAADDRAITDTFVVHPDAATATATLQQAAQTLGTSVSGGTARPVAVGAGGVMISGNDPSDAKAVTLLYFTEGRALVRLEFQSAPGDTTTDEFVTSVGKMQQIALRVGLA